MESASARGRTVNATAHHHLGYDVFPTRRRLQSRRRRRTLQLTPQVQIVFLDRGLVVDELQDQLASCGPESFCSAVQRCQPLLPSSGVLTAAVSLRGQSSELAALQQSLRTLTAATLQLRVGHRTVPATPIQSAANAFPFVQYIRFDAGNDLSWHVLDQQTPAELNLCIADLWRSISLPTHLRVEIAEQLSDFSPNTSLSLIDSSSAQRTH